MATLPHAGSWLGLPDFGITEAVGSVLGTPRTAQGGSNIMGGNSIPQTRAADLRPVYGPVQPSTVLGTSTGGGGVPTGGGGVATPGENNNPPLEQAPSEPNIDFDALIAPALSALDQAVEAQQSSYDANVAQIEANKAKGTGELQQSIQTGQTEAERNRQRVTGQSESAVDEARRQFAEIQQGLQARYGGTTGTGAFVEGLAGRQALRNIGEQRQALTQAVSQIDDRLEQIRSVAQLAIQDVEQQANAQKAQAKAQLDNALNSIRMAKGELLSRRVELAQNAMQFYQQQVAEVEQRNTAFQQRLYQQQQAAQEKLLSAKNTASGLIKQYQLVNINDNPYIFNPYTGQTQAPNVTQLGAGQLGAGLIGGQSELDKLNQQARLQG